MTHRTVETLLTPPDNWQWGDFHNSAIQKIRYGWNAPKNAKALIILAEGRTEVIEEYFELIRDFNDQGYACAIMDWQGQGLSYRYFDDNSRHHSESFDRDIMDFHEFITLMDTEKMGLSSLPKICFAHSMGGNIALRFMANYPEMFKAACVVAPMLGLNPKRIIKFTALPIIKGMTYINWLSHYAFGQRRWGEIFANIAKRKISSDPIRREVQLHLFKTRPELQCGGVTFGWLNEALKSIAAMHDPDICRKITIPVLIGIAGKDIVVNNEGTYITANLLPNSTIEVFKDAEHQIHRERDEIRDKFLSSFYKFSQKCLS